MTNERTHVWPMDTTTDDARCIECGISWVDHFVQPLCQPVTKLDLLRKIEAIEATLRRLAARDD